MDSKKEREDSDSIPDDGEASSPYEPTCRDGSAQTECWTEEER